MGFLVTIAVMIFGIYGVICISFADKLQEMLIGIAEKSDDGLVEKFQGKDFLINARITGFFSFLFAIILVFMSFEQETLKF